jgi:MoaA/NifB/PqqE/SkfB family radical SAM enzyme
MDAARLSNVLSVQRAYRGGETTAGAGPLVAYLEVAARCNLRCPMCPITVDPRHAPGSGLPALLSAELFERLSGVFPTLQRAHLFGLGEPFLNPHLVHYVERLASAGVETWTTTNATLVTEERADAIARAGLARVNVSIDGATPETYERIRRGGRLEEAVRGIRALAAARRRHGRPRIVLSMVTMASNLRELPGLVDLCAECGGDGVFAEELYSYSHPTIEELYSREHLGNLPREERRALFEEARRRARRHGLEFSSRVSDTPSVTRARSLPSLPPAGSLGSGAAAPALPFPCSEPWSTINVNAAGEVRTCCFNDQSFGRLDEEPAEAIWNGEAYARLRLDHAAGRTPDGCARCVTAGRVMKSPWFLPRFPAPAAADTAGEDTIRVDCPREGDPVAGDLVVAGTLPPRRDIFRYRGAVLEIFLDETLVATLGRGLGVERRRFAACLPIPFVTAGEHQFRLRWRRPGDRAPLAPEFSVPVVVFDPQGDGVPALSRAAVPVPLPRRETSPSWKLDNGAAVNAEWFCVRRAEDHLGILLVETNSLRRGPHELELTLSRQTVRRRLLRLGSRE